MLTVSKIEKMLEEKNDLYSKITILMNEKESKFKEEMNELNEELYRIQGEYRILKEIQEDVQESLETPEQEEATCKNCDNITFSE